jgi:hypothetical protein
MYSRILGIIAEADSLERAAAKQIFCWLTYAKTPLTIGLLYEAVHQCRLSPLDDSVKEVQAFREMIRVICGALVEFYDPKGNVEPSLSLDYASGVRFIHLSVQEHFLQTHSKPDSPAGPFVMERSFANLGLSLETLHALLRSGLQSTALDSDLSRYSVLYWTYHLHASVDQRVSVGVEKLSEVQNTLHQMIDALSTFLENPLLITQWVHSFYENGGSLVHGGLPYSHLKIWSEWLDVSGFLQEQSNNNQRTLERMKDFLRDLEQIVQQWHQRLQSGPDLIWDEAASFLDSDFLCKSTTRIKRLALTEPKRRSQSSRPLGDVSAISSDGQFNFRLSVWPSKAFEEKWESPQMYDRMKDASYAWSMRYEIWSIANESCLGEVEISLDQREVWLAMRQMLHEEHMGDWKFSFPMAISSNGGLVTILRTVYSLRLVNGVVTWKTALIQTDPTNTLLHWREHQELFHPKHPWMCEHTFTFKYRNRYSYSVTISATDTYLLLTDIVLNGTSINQILVFQIHQKDKLEIKEVARLPILNQILFKSVETVFHPEVALILVSDKQHVYFWNFLDGNYPPSSFP